MEFLKKFIHILANISYVLILLYILVCVPMIFGYTPLVVLSGSMEPELPVGSIVYYKSVSEEELQPRDIVVFQTDDQFVSHRIVEINDSGIVTKGDANENNDPNLVSYSAVRGVLSSVHIAFVGYFVWFINSYLLPIVLVIALILVSEFLFSNTRTFDINKNKEGRDKNEK